jgi:23S rRNA pseudouridine2605 synthase
MTQTKITTECTMTDNSIRLNKYISSLGITSRRKADELIKQGRVTVNNKTIIDLAVKIDPENDNVKVDGESIKRDVKKIYILLYKPTGIITSVSDEKKRETVIDLINIKEKVFPVGRLDYNTRGLLLITNDGELAAKLMHPRSEVDKTYLVKLSKPLEQKHREILSKGIRIDNKRTSPAKISFPKRNDYSTLKITIHEGRNRQVRKMFEKFGYFVRELERTEYAGLKLGNMKEGEWRKLTEKEVERLKEMQS